MREPTRNPTSIGPHFEGRLFLRRAQQPGGGGETEKQATLVQVHRPVFEPRGVGAIQHEALPGVLGDGADGVLEGVPTRQLVLARLALKEPQRWSVRCSVGWWGLAVIRLFLEYLPIPFFPEILLSRQPPESQGKRVVFEKTNGSKERGIRGNQPLELYREQGLISGVCSYQPSTEKYGFLASIWKSPFL